MQTQLNTNIRGYETGPIAAGGCTTAEIVAAGLGVPLQVFIDGQYIDSRTMSRRAGMILKYLPYLYCGVTGKLLTGGSYLFDTYENAKDYVRWASEEFEVGETKVKFTEQPMFDSFRGHVWKVIGAHNFMPIEQHAIGRLRYWTTPKADAELLLESLYDELRSSADSLNAASVWLLYNPETNHIGLQLGFAKQGGANITDATQTLHAAEKESSLGALLSKKLDSEPFFDRTSILLTLWLPKSRALGGSELAIPYYPMVPNITHSYS